MSVSSGVYPCYENQFQIGTSVSGNTVTYSDIADLTSFSVSIDNEVQEWTAMENEGWKSRLMTGKSLSISVTGKRNIGDTGNDKVASMWNKNGTAAQAPFKWTFPDGTTVVFDKAVISVTNNGTGESIDAAPLEFEVMSNGKPTVTPAA